MKPATLYGLLDCTEITDKLAEYDYDNGLTVPAIYHIWAKQDSPFPYIVYRLESIESNHWNKRTRYAYVDVWDYQEGGSTKTVDEIRRLVKNKLHMLNTEDDEWGAMRVRLDNADYVPEDEDYIIHHHSRFKVRAWDVDFIENSENY